MATPSQHSSPAVRAGIYTRISYDPAGQRAGVERQRLDCEALCHSRGWEVGGYLEDNDRSAFSGKPRRAYQQLLRAIETGEIDAIVTWHNDRLHRSPKGLEGFIDLVERTGVRVAVLRPDQSRRPPGGQDRRSRRPQGVGGPQPTGPAQASGAR